VANSQTLKIAGATLNQTPLDWSGNTSRIISALEQARKQNADLICFQEMVITAYGCEDLFLSDWLSEKAWEELEKIIPHCQGLMACITLPIRIDKTTYNAACVIRDKTILGITLKQNLALDGVHYEPRWFEPWLPGKIIEIVKNDKSIPVGDLIYEVCGIRFGFEICEDAWKVRPGESLHQRGVDLIINPSASHFALGKSISREDLVTESSGTFNCAYVYVNVLGNEAGRMIYDGDIIFAQKGKLLAINRRLSFKPYNILCCDFDFADPAQPHLTSDNGADQKERFDEFGQSVSLALYDYLRKSKAKGFVLSLSGGADSSCCAILVLEMIRRGMRELGIKNFCESLGLEESTNSKQIVKQLLTCAYQSTRNSSTITFEAAQKLAESIGASFLSWSVDEEVTTYTAKMETALGRSLSWDKDDIALQNIQARARSPIIWMLANIKGSLLLTTSNRSEGDVGYATMDGDTSGSLAPIAGIDKPFILQWLLWAEKKLGYSGLQYVNNLEPTAELRPADRSQTDEKDLMPYPVLVTIEKLALVERKSPVQVYQAMAGQYPSLELKGYIQKFFRLWSANQWKRERLAPSFHLDDLNVDPRSWCRFPILSGSFASELAELEQIS
jgi:NAD+ synthase (glutamine-hydrolysing)